MDIIQSCLHWCSAQVCGFSGISRRFAETTAISSFFFPVRRRKVLLGKASFKSLCSKPISDSRNNNRFIRCNSTFDMWRQGARQDRTPWWQWCTVIADRLCPSFSNFRGVLRKSKSVTWQECLSSTLEKPCHLLAVIADLKVKVGSHRLLPVPVYKSWITEHTLLVIQNSGPR